jgi:hypothetical protein
MNDVDPDKGRQTMASEEGPTQPTLDISNIYPATITCIMPPLVRPVEGEYRMLALASSGVLATVSCRHVQWGRTARASGTPA